MKHVLVIFAVFPDETQIGEVGYSRIIIPNSLDKTHDIIIIYFWLKGLFLLVKYPYVYIYIYVYKLYLSFMGDSTRPSWLLDSIPICNTSPHILVIQQPILVGEKSPLSVSPLSQRLPNLCQVTKALCVGPSRSLSKLAGAYCCSWTLPWASLYPGSLSKFMGMGQNLVVTFKNRR